MTYGTPYHTIDHQVTAQKMKFSINYFFSECDHVRRKLRISSHVLKKSLMENFIFCAVGVVFSPVLLDTIPHHWLPGDLLQVIRIKRASFTLRGFLPYFRLAFFKATLCFSSSSLEATSLYVVFWNTVPPRLLVWITKQSTNIMFKKSVFMHVRHGYKLLVVKNVAAKNKRFN